MVHKYVIVTQNKCFSSECIWPRDRSQAQMRLRNMPETGNIQCLVSKKMSAYSRSFPPCMQNLFEEWDFGEGTNAMIRE